MAEIDLENEAQLLVLVADDILESIDLENHTLEPTPDFWQALATGLRYLQAAISSRKLSVRQESLARLRYCQLLVEWTDNETLVESVLTKGIARCDQNRLFDLKYHMQYLMAKITHAKNPKAALRQVQTAANEARMQKHMTWVYIFEYLRVSFSLEARPKPNYKDALYSLARIADVAKKLRDSPMMTISALSGALVNLRAGSPDGVTTAREALATAQSQQTNQWVAYHPEILILMKIVDVSCYFIQGRQIEAYTSKTMKGIQALSDELFTTRTLKPNDRVWLPVTSSQTFPRLADTGLGGMVELGDDGVDRIAMSWLNGPNMMALTLFLSAHQDFARGQQVDVERVSPRTVEYLKNGLKVLKHPGGVIKPGAIPDGNQSYSGFLQFTLQHSLAMYHVMIRQWTAFDGVLAQLRRTLESIDQGHPQIRSVKAQYQYLVHVAAQARGDAGWHPQTFDDYLQLIETATLSQGDIYADLAILSVLNALLFLHQSPDHCPHIPPQTFAILERRSAKHPNSNIQAAFDLVRCMCHQTGSWLDMKKGLGSGLDVAFAMANTQLTTMMMAYTCTALQEDAVGENAIFSAASTVRHAAKLGDKLWMAVTEGILADRMEKSGNWKEAAEHQAVAQSLLSEVEV